MPGHVSPKGLESIHGSDTAWVKESAAQGVANLDAAVKNNVPLIVRDQLSRAAIERSTTNPDTDY